MALHSIVNTKYLAILFIILALPTGIRMALLTPMGQIPDEPSHIARADGLLYGQVLGYKRPGWGSLKNFTIAGVSANYGVILAASAELAPSFPASPLPPAARLAAQRIAWTKVPGFDFCPATVEYFPTFYLPGAAGLALGHLAGATPLQALFIGRLAMLASYLFLGAAAIWLAGFGRALLFALLLLPTPLALGASFNQDGQLIAAMALACALLTRDAQNHPWTRWAALTLIMLITCSKPPYGLLLVAAAAPLAAPGLFRRLGIACLYAIPPIIWLVLMAHYSYAPWPRLPPYHPGPLWPGAKTVLLNTTDPGANLRILFDHPAKIIAMPVQALWTNAAFLARGAVGALGWGPIMLSATQYAGWAVALAAAARATRAAPQFRLPDKILIAALLIASVFAMELSIYISWNNAGAAAIDGLAGRYYLLFVPFLIFLLPGARAVSPAAQTILTLPAIIMAAQDLVYLPKLLITTFHT